VQFSRKFSREKLGVGLCLARHWRDSARGQAAPKREEFQKELWTSYAEIFPRLDSHFHRIAGAKFRSGWQNPCTPRKGEGSGRRRSSSAGNLKRETRRAQPRVLILMSITRDDWAGRRRMYRDIIRRPGSFGTSSRNTTKKLEEDHYFRDSRRRQTRDLVKHCANSTRRAERVTAKFCACENRKDLRSRDRKELSQSLARLSGCIVRTRPGRHGLFLRFVHCFPERICGAWRGFRG